MEHLSNIFVLTPVPAPSHWPSAHLPLTHPPPQSPRSYTTINMRSLSILATAALAFLSTAHALLLVPRVSAPSTYPFPPSNFAHPNPSHFTACAQSCLTPGTVPFGNCSQNDKECLCKSPTYIQGVLNCITSSCTSQSDVDAAIFVPNALCQSLVRCLVPCLPAYLTRTFSSHN